MKKIVIIGAGSMGTAFAYPCSDNKCEVNIVGTHLENNLIDELKKNTLDYYSYMNPNYQVSSSMRNLTASGPTPLQAPYYHARHLKASTAR